jgi:hypothetical protein
VTEYVWLLAWLCCATAFVTWPHAKLFATHVVSHIDPLFSMWRLAWFAHAVATDESVLHGNIFHPEPYTLLLSDATFLQAVLAAPFIWAGVPLPILYNALLTLGMISSGLALYWVATGFGVSRIASTLAATIFTLAPYRIEHINHLELQWPTFAIVAFGALARVLYTPTWKAGVLLGVAMWLQFVASVYYAVYMLPLIAALALASLPTVPSFTKTIRVGMLALAVCGALTWPVARLYKLQSERVGGRGLSDISMFSAEPASYLATPEENVMYGATARILGAGEKRLFPGAAAIALGLAGLLSTRRRAMAASVIVVVLAADLSLGVNGFLYPLLLKILPPLYGLRAPARYAVYVLAGVAMLAALGWEAIERRQPPSARAATLAAAAILTLVCAEYLSPQTRLTRVDMDPPVYRFLNQIPEGVVLELPLPQRVGDAGLEADYEYWSTKHWRKLVNGYSGYTPSWYGPMLERLRSLPDPGSLALLRERNVRYILVHQLYMKPAELQALLSAFVRCPDLRPLGTFRDWAGPTAVFELIQ